MLYSRPQLRLLLLLAAIFLVGLGVREWRAGFPALADRIERFDREEPIAPLLPAARGENPPTQGQPKQKMTGVGAPVPPPEARDIPPPTRSPLPNRSISIARRRPICNDCRESDQRLRSASWPSASAAAASSRRRRCVR